MKEIDTLHITSGDCAGNLLAKSRIPGEVFVWHDIMYEGPRKPGWPDEAILAARAEFIEHDTGGGIERKHVLSTLRNQYNKLAGAARYKHIILWFDACLFDQSMLVHILTCLCLKKIKHAELVCIDSFSGIEPFNGLGQLDAADFASIYDLRDEITGKQFKFAKKVDGALAAADINTLTEIAQMPVAPLPFVPAAIKRFLREQPDPVTGIGQLEHLALEAIRQGCDNPVEIFKRVAATDSKPQYWGDTTLWTKINSLADHDLIIINGPAERLPQWVSKLDLNSFKITAR